MFGNRSDDSRSANGISLANTPGFSTGPVKIPSIDTPPAPPPPDQTSNSQNQNSGQQLAGITEPTVSGFNSFTPQVPSANEPVFGNETPISLATEESLEFRKGPFDNNKPNSVPSDQSGLSGVEEKKEIPEKSVERSVVEELLKNLTEVMREQNGLLKEIRGILENSSGNSMNSETVSDGAAARTMSHQSKISPKDDLLEGYKIG